MAILTVRDLSITFHGHPLLDCVSTQIELGQHIGLLGRNGSGKTTFMRILAGLAEPDAGEVQLAPGRRIAMLPQEVPLELTGTVSDIVHSVLAASLGEHDAAWEVEQRVEQTMGIMELDPGADFATLSSGMKRRVLLARALAAAPDVLLLDEPTNHLDIESITWLEGFLERFTGTLIFVTHDRRFLRKIANRILEIDRGRLFDWACDYDTFLERKEAALAAEEQRDALFDKKLAQEEVWIRKGIQARRTRNEGRVRALEKMRRERGQRRPAGGKVQLEIQQSGRAGTLVVKADGISVAYGERQILSDFSTTILRGDKVGILGPNGAGKTTLLRILLGEQQPQAGKVKLGTSMKLVYFDQLREQLNPEESVQECVSEGADTLEIGGRNRHILSYLEDFLFTPARARLPVKMLSGGERNRVLLARLFSKPANVLVMDEPTNDLDTETLELLEEQLANFDGTVLLVSHDREFLNNVVTTTIVFEPDGVREYTGGYDDWLRQFEARQARHAEAAATAQAPVAVRAPAKKQAKLRASYKEQQELAGLPARIEECEAQIQTVHDLMAKPAFYQSPGEEIARQQALLKTLEATVATLTARWEELEQLG